MERTIDDEARMLVEYNTAQYQYLMRLSDRYYEEGDIEAGDTYREVALQAARRIDDLRGLTDEGVR